MVTGEPGEQWEGRRTSCRPPLKEITFYAKPRQLEFVSLDGVVNHMDKWHFDYVSERPTTWRSST